LQVLIEHGAKVDIRDFRGYSPVHLAISHGHAITLRTLVNAGAVIIALRQSMPIIALCCHFFQYKSGTGLISQFCIGLMYASYGVL